MRHSTSVRLAAWLAVTIGIGSAWSAVHRADAADANVQIAGFAFAPASVTVNVGESVTWTHNDGGVPHSVAFSGGPVSPNLTQGGTYVRTFDSAGTFSYQCGIHPAMTGSVTVAAAQQPTATATSLPPTPTLPGATVTTPPPANTPTTAVTTAATITPVPETPTPTGTPVGATETPTPPATDATPTATPTLAPLSNETPSPGPSATPANGGAGNGDDDGGGNAWWLLGAVAIAIAAVGGGAFALSRRRG
jgi:plastocyanin